MALLRPEGVKAKVAGEEHNLLFTLRAVERIEEEFNLPTLEVIKLLDDPVRQNAVVASVITALVNDNQFWSGTEEYEKEELTSVIPLGDVPELKEYIFKAFMESFPKQDEDEDPNQKRSRSRKRSTSPGSSTSVRKNSDSQSEKSQE